LKYCLLFFDKNICCLFVWNVFIFIWEGASIIIL
jgi:hypothetical protein